MKWLVTGGAGFIGGNFIYRILDMYPRDEVVCVDKLTYAGNMQTLERAKNDPRFSFYKEDIADARAMAFVIGRERPDAVVNFAAESHVDRSIADPSVFVRTNVLGVQSLLEACRKHGVARFHQVSTDEVYGEIPRGVEGMAFSERSKLNPSSPYAASKASADLLALAWHKTYGMHVTVSRSSNNYGPYQFPEKLIPLAIVRAVKGQPIPVYGDGANVRDWLYVSDHCAAVDLIVRRGRAGEVYNVCGGEERTNLETVGAVAALVGRGEIEFVADRPGHDFRYAADSAKLREELGFSPAVAFGEGIRRTVGWYLSHRDWWENILSGKYRKFRR